MILVQNSSHPCAFSLNICKPDPSYRVSWSFLVYVSIRPQKTLLNRIKIKTNLKLST